MSSDTADTLIADRYRLGRVIGVGGMGVVYEAEQLPLRRTVAVKMLTRDRVGSEEAVQRLIREAQALSRIEHPGVVRVIDAGRSSRGQAFLAMEYLEGCTLKQLLVQHGPLPWRWVLAAIRQCLDALEVVHRAGFVHRDIKPSNCFCCACSSADGVPLGADVFVVKLIDFGIAKAERSRRALDALPLEAAPSELAHDGPLLGTPAYWAPEQAQTGQATRRSDIYSMGATLYELLTGVLPARFDGGRLEPPSAANPAVGIPPDLDAVVLKALSADSEQRFESASGLHAALLAVESGRSERTTTWPGVEAPPLVGAPLVARSSLVPRPALPLLGSNFAATPSGAGAQLLRLRAKVQEFWIEGVLRASLSTALPSPPRTLEQELVAGLGQDLQAPPPSLVPEARSTAELFEHHGRSALIVGSAGSGKTTQLLLVARQLLESFKEEVPVVLTLSSWKGERWELEEWLTGELRSKYQVPIALSHAWLRRGLILPLLDGLDEVPAKYRSAAIRSINRAIGHGRLPGLLVTSRSKEYFDSDVRLGLSLGLRLHPLRSAAVDELRELRSPFARLSPEQWHTLRPLLDSPLALSLLSSALGSGPLPFAPTPRGTAQLDDLLDVYTEQMIHRSGKARLPCDPREFLEVVAQLAHEMNREQTDIFAPDGVQPSWLDGARAKVIYALVSRCVAAGVYASSLILSFGLTPLYNGGLPTGFEFGCVLAGFTTLTVGGVHGAAAARGLISSARRRIGARQHWTRVAVLAVVSGAINAALLGSWANHPMAAVMAGEVAVLAAPLVSPHAEIGDVRGDIRLVDRLRFSVAKALRSAIFGVAAGIIAALVANDAGNGVTAMSVVILYLTGICFLFGGLRGRQVSTGARPYTCLIHSCQWSVALGVLAIPLAALPTAITYGGHYGFYVGLTTGAVLWLWYGGMALVQYVVLRAMLSLQGARYFRTAYLEAAADRALLHRLGSGYLFVHPMLRANVARRWRPRQQR
jgi:serine/threonine protein kinase